MQNKRKKVHKTKACASTIKSGKARKPSGLTSSIRQNFQKRFRKVLFSAPGIGVIMCLVTVVPFDHHQEII